MAKATPATGSIRRVAECKRCGDTIENHGDGWWHAYTGSPECDETIEPSPR